MTNASFSEDLLNWYDQHQRNLPWRTKDTTPYQTWLSEIMLQQTVVKTVLPYYHRFLQKWPHFQALSQATLDEVLYEWQGLGYYARARNLWKCAQVVAQDYQGQLPEDYQTLLTLPGLGPYTAAAISAIAFGRRAPVIDGNIVRVLSRYFRVDQPYPASRAILNTHYQSVLSNRPGDFAQALMDLSQSLCRPQNPSCSECPLQKGCQAFQTQTVHKYPIITPKAPPQMRRSIAWVLQDQQGRIALKKRPPEKLLGGLYEVPTTPPWDGSPMAPEQLRWFEAQKPQDLGTIQHRFTHIDLTLQVYGLQDLHSLDMKDYQWVDLKRDPVMLSTLMKKVLKLRTKPFPEIDLTRGTKGRGTGVYIRYMRIPRTRR